MYVTYVRNPDPAIEAAHAEALALNREHDAKARRAFAFSVKCPTCGVRAGDGCVFVTIERGKPMYGYHGARIYAARARARVLAAQK